MKHLKKCWWLVEKLLMLIGFLALLPLVTYWIADTKLDLRVNEVMTDPRIMHGFPMLYGKEGVLFFAFTSHQARRVTLQRVNVKSDSEIVQFNPNDIFSEVDAPSVVWKGNIEIPPNNLLAFSVPYQCSDTITSNDVEIAVSITAESQIAPVDLGFPWNLAPRPSQRTKFVRYFHWRSQQGQDVPMTILKPGESMTQFGSTATNNFYFTGGVPLVWSVYTNASGQKFMRREP